MTQRSDEWLHIKKGEVSGTQAKGLMGTPKAKITAMYDILGESLTVGIDNNDHYESPMERGNRLEPEARMAYEDVTGYTVDEVGFCQHDLHDGIGNSPDGLVGEHGAIEIKCPEHTNYMRYWINLEIDGDDNVVFAGFNTTEIPDDYIWQVVQYFLVNEKLEWLDFVSYNPDIASYPMHIIHVTREQLAPQMEKLLVKEVVFVENKINILSKIVKF